MGGKGSSSQTYDDLKPKTQQMIDLENKFYGVSDQIFKGGETGDYGSGQIGQWLNTARDQQNSANDRYNDLFGQLQGINQSQMSALNNAQTAGQAQRDKAQGFYDQAGSAGNEWYDKGMGQLDKAAGMVRQADENATLSSESNKWYDQYAQGQLGNASDLLATGNIPAELEARMMDTINRGTKSGMGSMLNDLAGRGVINSSVSNSGISRLGQQAADAYNDGYLDTFNSVLQGYQGNAGTAAQAGKAFADTYMNINRDLNSGAQTAMNIGNSYNSAGSQRTSDLLNVGNAQQNAGNQAFNDQLNLAGGYNQAGMSNLMQQDQIMNQIPQYWQNALASLGLPQQFLDQMQQDRARDTRTTVVDQGKK